MVFANGLFGMPRWSIKVSLMIAVIGLAGCSKTSTSGPISGVKQFEPQFFDKDSSQKDPVVDSDSRFSFLVDSIFLAGTIDVSKATAAPQLNNVDWKGLEKSLEQWLGKENSRFDLYERVWLLVDRSISDFLMEGGNDKSRKPPVVILFETKNEIGEGFFSQLPKIAQSPEKAKGELSNDFFDLTQPGLFACKLSKKQIAIGPKEILQRMVNREGGRFLQNKIAEGPLDRTLDVFVHFQPISGYLNTVAQFAKQMGGDDSSQMILAITAAHLSGDLTAEDLLKVTVDIDDPKTVDQLAQMLNDSITSSSGGSSPMLGMLNERRRNAQFLEPHFAEAGQKLIGEIQSKNLATTTKSDKSVSINVKRAEAFDEFLVAVINDAQSQFSNMQRLAAFDKISKAVAAFNKKNGHLPWDMPLQENPNAEAKNQFSWRVAILPELGEQELYDRFDFTQPFDSEVNRKVAEAMPQVFDNCSQPGKTSIRLVAGSGRLYAADLSAPPVLDSIKDARNRTAIIIEGSAKLAAPWTAPDSNLPESPTGEDFGMPLENGVIFIDAEFRVRGIRKSNELVSAILSIAGSESINRQDLISVDFGLQQPE